MAPDKPAQISYLQLPKPKPLEKHRLPTDSQRPLPCFRYMVRSAGGLFMFMRVRALGRAQVGCGRCGGPGTLWTKPGVYLMGVQGGFGMFVLKPPAVSQRPPRTSGSFTGVLLGAAALNRQAQSQGAASNTHAKEPHSRGTVHLPASSTSRAFGNAIVTAAAASAVAAPFPPTYKREHVAGPPKHTARASVWSKM